MLECLLAEQSNRSRADDDDKIRSESPRKAHDVNAVGQRLGYGGGFSRKRLGPYDQTAFGRGDILGESAAAIHAEYLPPRAEVRISARTANALVAVNQRVRHDARAPGE